jgi:hypothetical protein
MIARGTGISARRLRQRRRGGLRGGDGGDGAGEGVKNVGGDDTEGEDAADQEDAESARGPVESDERTVAGVAEAGFPDDAVVGLAAGGS